MSSATALSLAAVVAAFASGCAAPDPSASTEVKPVREYRTGSNIPARDAQPTSDEERARAAEMIDRLRRPSPTGKPGG
jgi:type IV pilus biogenesis protein CpaD/CtpE